MSSIDRFKTITLGKVVKLKGKWVIQERTVTQKFDLILRKWQNDSETVKHIPVSERFTKKLEIEAIYVKSAQNWVGIGNPPQIYFLAKFKVEIPHIGKYKDHWLSLVEGRPIINAFPHFVWEISLDEKSDFVEKLGEPKPISLEKTQELFKSKKGIYPRLLKMVGSQTVELV